MMRMTMTRGKEEEEGNRKKQERTMMVKKMIKRGEKKIRNDQRKISRTDKDDEKMENEGRRKNMTRYTYTSILFAF
jgi:negative regulator of genetic competence, sporulation and motility